MPTAIKKEFVADSARLMTDMADLNFKTTDGGLNFSYDLMIVEVFK